MTRALRAGIIALLLLAVWPEFDQYRAEWMIAQADARLDRILRGLDRGDPAFQSAGTAAMQAHTAGSLLPGDPRPPLFESIALLLRHQGPAATAVLEAAIAQGERPELTLNLGRARGISGDAAGASAAFLRTAWVSPAALATLPVSIRSPLLEQVKVLESELRAGTLLAAPPL